MRSERPRAGWNSSTRLARPYWEGRMTDLAAPPSCVIWRVVEADGKVGEPVRCKTVDGLHSWERDVGESADAFESRVIASATRLSGRRSLIMTSQPGEESP
jgi:hypothetical protein